MPSEVISAVILFVFAALLLIGALSTLIRWIRYRQQRIRPPLLLKRDTALLGGLSFPLLLISIVRAFGFSAVVVDPAGVPEIWWLLLTGLPAIAAVAVYVYFELVVIERLRRRN